jgi:two-component system CheB/CheR fusion protein
VFSCHNLLDDPPFSKLDLISCRNVLIYLGAAQGKIMSLFHYALVERGFLMVGRSETTHNSELFASVEPGQRIYARRRVVRRPYRSFARTRTVPRGGDARSETLGPPAPRSPGISRDADRIVLSRYSPTGVVVDEDLQVLELRGQTAPFIALTPGKASLHLLKLLPDTGLFLEVERLTHKAARTGQRARSTRIPYHSGGHRGDLDIEVPPLGSTEQPAYLGWRCRWAVCWSRPWL